MKKLSIIQVVGYKHSGKTTLINKIISSIAKDLNLTIGTLKHHGHGGEPDVVKGTDTYKHMESGALISGVQGENRFQLNIAQTATYRMDELIAIYEYFPVDLLIIEGYKRASFPKIVLINEREDKPLLQLSNIIAVGGWKKPNLIQQPYPLFSINHFNDYQYLFKNILTTFN